MDKKYEAIGVLDSGLGGLSVLREAIKIMKILYFLVIQRMLHMELKV